MTIQIPKTVINDIGRFDGDEFGDPKWIIMRNNSGLQLQMFWPSKGEDGVKSEENGIRMENNNITIPEWHRQPLNPSPPIMTEVKKKRSKRKRSPQRVIQSDEEIRFVPSTLLS